MFFPDIGPEAGPFGKNTPEAAAASRAYSSGSTNIHTEIFSFVIQNAMYCLARY